MAALHTALKSLSPVAFSEVPSDKADLDSWLSDIFVQSQLILDSIPITDPLASSHPISHSTTSIASNASEITSSSARSAPPALDHQALQKEWGKPVKLSPKENPLDMSVYKLGGKDGKGAWFARRSVHEGLPFSRFRQALEMEFPESLAVQGAPGEGNVRGIGGETKVEDIVVPGKGRIEVYRLSAQFPGPTTPRDFVTLLITSNGAISSANDQEPAPRHHLIISKPCNHPATQPQSGFIRGFYESVEFIREVPRKKTTVHSVTDLPSQAGKDKIVESADQNPNTSSNLDDMRGSSDEDANTSKRAPAVPGEEAKDSTVHKEGENNPVEWIMVTRSDPGGSVPRFMVERGTPSSICADAEKFLNWACRQDFDDAQIASAKDGLKAPSQSHRKESFASFRSSRIAGVQEEHTLPPQYTAEHSARIERPIESNHEHGFIVTTMTDAVSGAARYISSYAPQVVLDHLPGSHNNAPTESIETLVPRRRDDDNNSVLSRASFESADSHFTTDESEANSHDVRSSVEKDARPLSHHEKELLKLESRRTALVNKFSESRSKLEQESAALGAKEEQARQKAEEKHEKDMKKQREKYEKELRKIEEKQEKERKKLEQQKLKQLDKDEKARLTRERDEARQELELTKKEVAVLKGALEDLQKENTTLAAQLGRSTLAETASEGSSGHKRSSSSLRRLAEKGRTGTASGSNSMKSQ